MKRALTVFCDELPLVDPTAFLVAMVHDEAQCEVDPDRAELVGELGVRSMRQTGGFFKLRCELDGEAKVGKDWSATH